MTNQWNSLLVPAVLLALLGACSPAEESSQKPEDSSGAARVDQGDDLVVQYLEYVTTDVDGVCAALSALHGVDFGEPVAALGNARKANLKGGSWLGVRAPLRSTEEPIVRPYFLVSDIEAAVKEAEAKGAVLALPPTPIEGFGRCAIYLQGGNEFGLWEL